MAILNKKPKVIIAGAGPGDAGLITIKAAKYLGMANFILVDRLVSHEILKQYANPDAIIIYVGKHGGQESTHQEYINDLLIDYGRKPGITVRLKGGDVAIFSRLTSEIETLNEHKIPFEIIPGITAASGASASLRVPLTIRSLSQGVRFLTYYDDEQVPNLNWYDLAQTTDTLIFYMTAKSLPALVTKISQFAETDKALGIVEQATTPQERIIISSLFRFQEELGDAVIHQPAVIIIGEVVNLCNKPSQLNQLTSSFFKEHTYAA